MNEPYSSLGERERSSFPLPVLSDLDDDLISFTVSGFFSDPDLSSPGSSFAHLFLPLLPMYLQLLWSLEKRSWLLADRTGWFVEDLLPVGRRFPPSVSVICLALFERKQ
jgi:hypothetical protein